MIACKARSSHVYQLRLKIVSRKILRMKVMNSSSKQVFFVISVNSFMKLCKNVNLVATTMVNKFLPLSFFLTFMLSLGKLF